ncbi:MAG: arylsulfatase [Planctomycetes bacterium]|nr:arylsulfatase [Planctomycetota bacterium]
MRSLPAQPIHRRSKPSIIAGLAAALVLPGTLPICAPAAAAAEAPKPNIILIVADDLGYGHLGAYGQKKIHTPHLDRLAAEGMRFTQMYAGSHVCQPSRSVLMTGLHTGHTPVRANDVKQLLYDKDVTVAELLGEAGYTSGGFGKWGLGFEGTSGHPLKQGFDEFFGQLLQVHAHFYYPYWAWHNNEKVLFPENEGGRRGTYIQDAIHSHALTFIRKNHERPLFAYLPYIIPHVELVVPEDSEKPYRGKFPKRAILDTRPGYIGSEDGYATVAGMISRLDRQVGGVLALVKELGIDDNTLIIFTSDNGAQNGGKDAGWTAMTDFFEGNGPLRGYKGTFYEGGLRVPFIARWPGRIEPGTLTDHIAAFQDVLPTLAELAGVEPPENIDGLSLVPTLLARGEQREHDGLYWEYARSGGLSRAARIGRWKAVQNGPRSPVELYDLETDISESTNVAAKHPEIVERLTKFMDAAHEPPRDFPPRIERPTIKDYVR